MESKTDAGTTRGGRIGKISMFLFRTSKNSTFFRKVVFDGVVLCLNNLAESASPFVLNNIGLNSIPATVIWKERDAS